jgi:hypothetical protein
MRRSRRLVARSNIIRSTKQGGLARTSRLSQLASLTRTDAVSGNNVSITGYSLLVDTGASAQAGFTVTNISSNVLYGSSGHSPRHGVERGQ